jgi:PAS domain S-box-containing protein
LRFVNHLGNEKIRIQFDQNSFLIIPEENLSESRFYFYFIFTDSLQKDQIVFMPVELLNLSQETTPAISFATRIYDSAGNFCGIFIADIFAKNLFSILEEKMHHEFERKLAIVNNEGYYLYHSEKKKNWNRLLASREVENLFKEYPHQFSEAILSGEEGIVYDEYHEIVAYTPLFTAKLPGGISYYIFESVEKSSIFGPVHSFALMFVSFILLFIVISIALGFVATTQMVGSVRKLQKGAEIISKGDYMHRIEIQTNDEIEQLASQFNKMADALAGREKLLAEHQKKLEETVIARTRELSNEKEKLQVILDNVPSAFLLLDGEYNILLASAAIGKISGKLPKDLIGEKCYVVFSNESYCKNCDAFLKTGDRSISSHIEIRKNAQGDEVYIEHISISLNIENRIYSCLEILTDITERKQIEQHLMKTEKLAATGEMSAVIAHEIRNSLTSIKMILQLQHESSLSESDRKSLDVAITSILRLENVVSNLLRFARPAPFEYQMRDINQIINDSLLLTEPQIIKNQIKLVKNLETNLPKISLDTSHLKDGFVNIILNAIQAIDQNGKIQITTKKTKLKKQIEDITYPNRAGFETNESNYKIILRPEIEVIEVEIADNGIGIEKDKLNKIFDPFFTTKLNGTGLGLAMVKRTVNTHGGVILAESNKDSGAVFRLYFPVRVIT